MSAPCEHAVTLACSPAWRDRRPLRAREAVRDILLLRWHGRPVAPGVSGPPRARKPLTACPHAQAAPRRRSCGNARTPARSRVLTCPPARCSTRGGSARPSTAAIASRPRRTCSTVRIYASFLPPCVQARRWRGVGCAGRFAARQNAPGPDGASRRRRGGGGERGRGVPRIDLRRVKGKGSVPETRVLGLGSRDAGSGRASPRCLSYVHVHVHVR